MEMLCTEVLLHLLADMLYMQVFWNLNILKQKLVCVFRANFRMI